MSEERYWIESARVLARLLERIPGLRDSDFGDDPLESLANYVPAQGSLDETTESLRRVFTSLFGYCVRISSQELGLRFWESSQPGQEVIAGFILGGIAFLVSARATFGIIDTPFVYLGRQA